MTSETHRWPMGEVITRCKTLVFLAFIFYLSTALSSNAQTPRNENKPRDSSNTTSDATTAFEIASVRLSAPNTPLRTNFGLDSFEDSGHLNGIFRANTNLKSYIEFAFGLLDFHEQEESLRRTMPSWAFTNPLAIDARAEGNPTKDEVRRMVRTLLEERLRLKTHDEVKQLPVYELVLAAPGRFGAGLQVHRSENNCLQRTTPNLGPASKTKPSTLYCGDTAWQENDLLHLKTVNVSFKHFAELLTSLGALQGDTEHQLILDGTGLSERYDIELVFRFRANARVDAGPDAGGQTAIEAMRTQLGLKLVKRTEPVKLLVIDHVEKPTEN